MPVAHMMFGLPASGKSTFIRKEAYGQLKEGTLISADDIKRDEQQATGASWGELHQWGVQQAELAVYNAIENGLSIIFDGGGINNSYSHRIHTALAEAGYEIRLYHFDTHVTVCLTRNARRDKNRVDPDAIINKSFKLQMCLERLRRIPNTEYIRIPYKFDHFFVDMDGVIAAMQPFTRDSKGNIDFVAGRMFKYSKPVEPVIGTLKFLSKRDGIDIHIMSAAPDSLCMADKVEWLDRHMKFVPTENYYFIGNARFKHVMLENLLNHRKIAKDAVLVIDDSPAVLQGMMDYGIPAIHPSALYHLIGD